MIEKEFPNGYTVYFENGRLFISNQRTSRKVPYYKNAQYLAQVSETGQFEFHGLTLEEAQVIADKVEALDVHDETNI